MKLKKSQKNDIYNALESYGFTPNQFRIEEEEVQSFESDEPDFKIINNDDGNYMFSATIGIHNCVIEYSPGGELYIEEEVIEKNWRACKCPENLP